MTTKKIDVSHLDSYAWSLLSHSKKAERAAVKMAEALEQAALAIDGDDDEKNLTVDAAFEQFVEPVLEKYSEFGANDTEPRTIARLFLVYIFDNPSKPARRPKKLVASGPPKRRQKSVCLMAWAKPYHGTPDPSSKRIYSGISNRAPFDIYLDGGGPNRLNPAVQDPPALLITTNGRCWQIPVPDLGNQLSGVAIN